MTSWPSVHTDLKNAGANWVDKEVIQDGNLITSRKPEDIPVFSNKLIEALAHPLAKASWIFTRWNGFSRCNAVPVFIAIRFNILCGILKPLLRTTRRSHPKCRHLDRSEAQWRDPCI